MRLPLGVIALLLLPPAGLGCAAGGGMGGGGGGGDVAAVAATIERYHAALASGDTAEAMGLLAPRAVILESGGVESRSEYREHHLPADMEFARGVTHERGPIEVRVEGDVAWASSTSSSRGRFREREVNSQGAELMVLRRSGGGWLIEAIHWSSRNRAP